MSRLLLIQASARQKRSLSRALAADFLEHWKKVRPDDQIIVRDVGLNPPPATTEAWIAAAFTPEAQRTPEQVETLKISDELINEIIPAETVVIATPMYNYGMPAALKAWFDQVIRINRTFSFDLARGEQPIEPMQSGKTVVILSASGEGGFLVHGPMRAANHLHPHILIAGKLLGFERHEIIAIEYQEFDDDRHAQSIKDAQAAIPGLVERLTQWGQKLSG